MENNTGKKGFNLKEVILVIILTAILTSITTGVIVYNQNKISKNMTYRDLVNDTPLQEFIAVYASLIDEYYEKVDKQEMLESAISAMFNYLGEDYSTYMSKEETNALAEKLNGEYKGIGISYGNDFVITKISKNSPAEKTGILIGDKVIKIDDKNVTDIDAAAYIKDKNIGDNIKIEIMREEESLNFKVKVARILTESVTNNIYNDHIGYLKISTFSNTLGEQTKIALDELEKKGIDSLIIDLRDNTGGYLSAANDVASMFLEKGKVIYSLEENNGIVTFKDETFENRKYKIAVLINDGSASASEILAAALVESYGAATVGETSYGKGRVQQTHSLSDGSMVKYTTARWLTPNNNCIDGVGIIPNYPVDNYTFEIDEQLNKAIEVIEN